MEKTDLLILSPAELIDWFTSIGEKPFRAKQVDSWIHCKLVTDFDAMTNISKPLRESLKERAQISFFQSHTAIEGDPEGTLKFLFTLEDGLRIESVLIKHGDRKTVCVSSQVGCAVGCAFCATGKMKDRRNLTVSEIVNQFLYIKRNYEPEPTNIVFMGMGEPFFNYDNVIKAAQIFNEQSGLKVGARKITISTAGVVKEIYRYKEEEHKFKLAISLTGRNDEIRDKLIPLNKKYKLESILKAAEIFSDRPHNRITFEWVLIKDWSDTNEDLAFLKKLSKRMPCKINLIPLNPVDSEFEPPSQEHLDDFFHKLQDANCRVTIRNSSGSESQAACGQLNSDYYQK